MKPLVYWCRWNEARLMLHGRNPASVWGVLKYWKDNDRMVPFSFQFDERRLTIDEEQAQLILYLDEMGTLIEEEGSSS